MLVPDDALPRRLSCAGPVQGMHSLHSRRAMALTGLRTDCWVLTARPSLSTQSRDAHGVLEQVQGPCGMKTAGRAAGADGAGGECLGKAP